MSGRKLAYTYLAGLVFVAIFASLLANDRPLAIYHGGTMEFPALQGRGEHVEWDKVDADWVVWPPIPFRASSPNLEERAYRPPLSRNQQTGKIHLLGTDRTGRDTAAGLISGSRVAVLVGLGSLLISLLIGLPLGAAAGYFGNDGIRLPRYRRLSIILGTCVGGVYAFACLRPLAEGVAQAALLTVLSIVICFSLCHLLLSLLSRYVGWLGQSTDCPIDRMVVFLLEMTVSIPGLVVLIALLAYSERSSLFSVVLFIGLLGWTPVARFLRAELMRVRELPYIAAARMGGVGEWRLLYRHALPNAIGPVVVVAAFMVGTSILAESMLSFLGFGLAAGQVTWGSILDQSTANTGAWWLAVFPGLLLTLTILACNSLRKTS